jgi:hypothetical protein
MKEIYNLIVVVVVIGVGSTPCSSGTESTHLSIDVKIAKLIFNRVKKDELKINPRLLENLVAYKFFSFSYNFSRNKRERKRSNMHIASRKSRTP